MRIARTTKRLIFALTLLLAAAGPALAQEAADVYLQEVQPMTTLECGRCHVQVFADIRDRGGLHRQECRDCHESFHNFKQGVPWSERVPACAACHEEPHGSDLVNCLSCHSNAHAPVESLIGAGELASACTQCHQEQAGEIERHRSAHSEMGCVDCHEDRHGNTPSCADCHEEPHTPFLDDDACVACHAPHSPKEIVFTPAVGNSSCTPCHDEALGALADSNKKHSGLRCSICHSGSHGKIPACQDCHDSGPHNPSLLAKFEGCLDCHGDPHRLSFE